MVELWVRRGVHRQVCTCAHCNNYVYSIHMTSVLFVEPDEHKLRQCDTDDSPVRVSYCQSKSVQILVLYMLYLMTALIL